MAIRSIADIDVAGKRVLIRADLNVPLADGEIADDTRIRESLATIRLCIEGNAKVIVASHLGRPKGTPNPKYTLAPVAKHMAELLGRPVRLAPDCVGAAVEAAAAELADGDVLLLENTRFHPEEEKNDIAMAASMARLCDIYVNDAFGTAHRAHVSTEGVAQHVKEVAAGLLMLKEIEALNKLLHNPAKPFVNAIGGAKVSDKMGVIRNLFGRVDEFLIGGAMAYTFLKARGVEIGDSLVEIEKVDAAKQMLEEAEAAGVRIHLPLDHVTASGPDADARTTPGVAIEPGQKGFDIGPLTIALYRERIAAARTVLWNGPMGMFEKAPFSQGTLEVAKALAESTAYTVVGGGDSLAALNQAGLADRIAHVSTGGGASLEYLEGLQLPGIRALDR
jgi:phosphoglycerate kinase